MYHHYFCVYNIPSILVCVYFVVQASLRHSTYSCYSYVLELYLYILWSIEVGDITKHANENSRDNNFHIHLLHFFDNPIPTLIC